MSKRVAISNFRVEVTPRRLGYLGSVSVPDRFVSSGEEDRQKQYRQRCEEIIANIKRHVDDVGHMEIVYDTDGECEHCGSRWTEDSDSYNGGCCEKDESAMLAEGSKP